MSVMGERFRTWGSRFKRIPFFRLHTVLIACGIFIAGFAAVGIQIYAMHPLVGMQTSDFFQHVGWIFTGVPRNFDAFLMTVAFVLSGIAPGYAFTGACPVQWRNPIERMVFSTMVGLAIVTVIVLALGSVGLLRPNPLFVLEVMLLIATAIVCRNEFRAAQRTPPQRPVENRLVVALLAVVVVVLLFVVILPGALEYELSFDGMHYHLAEAKRFALHGGFYDLVRSERAYEAAFPHYQEDIYAALVSLYGLIGAKLLSWAECALAVAAICLFANELLGSLVLGLLASIAFISIPVVMFSASSASNDIPLASATLLAVYALFRWREDRRLAGAEGWLVIAGALAGFCSGIKPFGLVGTVTLGAFIVWSNLSVIDSWRSRSIAAARSAAIFALAFAVFVAPSYINSWLWTGNPFFPIFGPPINNGIAVDYHSHIVSTILTLPWNMLTNASYKNLVGPLMIVLGVPALIALFWRGRNVNIIILAGIAAFWSVLYLVAGAFEARYAEAIFPLVCIVLMYPLVRPIRGVVQRLTIRYTLGGVLFAIVVLNLPFLLPLQRVLFSGGMLGGINYNWLYLYTDVPYHGEAPVYIPMLPFMNATLTATDKVYDNADLAGVNSYSTPELFFDAPAYVKDWTILSAEAPAQFHLNGIGYLVTFQKNVPDLIRSPLGKHLSEVKRFPATQSYGGDHQYDEVLFGYKP